MVWGCGGFVESVGVGVGVGVGVVALLLEQYLFLVVEVGEHTLRR